MIRIIFKLLILSIIIISCEKENLENNKNAKLHFSEDTITLTQFCINWFNYKNFNCLQSQ